MAARASLPIVLLAACVGVAYAEGQGRWQPLANKSDCSVWNASPEADETASWSGSCKDGFAEGNGTLIWRYSRDGGRLEETYVGAMGKGKLHGHGVFVWPNGDRFEGHWEDDKANGYGVAVWADGARYEGGWREDKRDGYGIFVDANGDRFEGGWKDNRPHGKGAWHGKDGDTLSGAWTNGCFKQGGRVAWIGTTEEACGFD